MRPMGFPGGTETLSSSGMLASSTAQTVDDLWIYVGIASLLLGVLFKALIDDGLHPIFTNRLNKRENREQAARALFRQMYLGPDLALFSLGLLLSSQSFTSLLGKPNPIAPVIFSSLLIAYVFGLGVTLLLWLVSGPAKFCPINTTARKLPDEYGNAKDSPGLRIDWVGTIRKREGVFTLVVGNSVGVACIYSYLWYLSAPLMGTVD